MLYFELRGRTLICFWYAQLDGVELHDAMAIALAMMP